MIRVDHLVLNNDMRNMHYTLMEKKNTINTISLPLSLSLLLQIICMAKLCILPKQVCFTNKKGEQIEISKCFRKYIKYKYKFSSNKDLEKLNR